MELIRLLFWALFMTMFIAGLGAYADVRNVKKGFSERLKPKWLWNIVEFVALFSLIYLKANVLPWWHYAWLCGTMIPVWSILHDCWIGLGLTGNPWYLGQSKWDQKISAIFNQFGTKHPGKIYFYFKLFWFSILTGGFFSL